MENGDINDIYVSQDINLSNTVLKRPLELLLYKYELKLTQFFVVVDKNGEFRGQQKK
jgi:hypothetical protein